MRGRHPENSVHDAVGAYALGILDDDEATQFEIHLATCDYCGNQLEELSGLGPMLATLADFPGTGGTPEIGRQLAERPSERLADRLVGEVVRHRAVKRRRGLYLVAAAAALIIGGPTVAVVATESGDSGKKAPIAGGTATPRSGANPAEEAFRAMDDKVESTDSVTKVTATVGMKDMAWGTSTVIELKNVKGPLKCSLVAVSKSGEEETVTSWSVPNWGYGIEDSPNKTARSPLYVQGGAAMDRSEIDHFEVRTFDGDRLVDVDA
ncbi:RNA polymerase subunit sigma [Streptomyces sp. GC420]|nr:RNA polymerase subunit sigma [Streptomyces sp. GC420]